MKSNYLFTYVFPGDETTEEKELENFQDCLMHAAKGWHLLKDENEAGYFSPQGGRLQRIIITHARTGYVLFTLSIEVLYALYNGIGRGDNPEGVGMGNLIQDEIENT